LDFLLGLRHRIEHRHLPDLDPALYGECQSALMNFEELVVKEFGSAHALAESLAVSLQFSSVLPEQKEAAARRLAAADLKGVMKYVETFRKGLPVEVLNDSKFSFRVYLVPKLANRESAADIAVEFVPYDKANPAESKKLDELTALIREKQVPVANLNLLRPGQVVAALGARIPFPMNHHVHARAWRHYGVRPAGNSAAPEKTKAQHCVYDSAHGDYVYTQAWVEFLAKELSDAVTYKKVVGAEPVPPPASPS